MNLYRNADITGLVIRLNEVRSLFDQKLQEGKNFEEVKKIYMQIKDLESQINGIKGQVLEKSAS